MPAQESNHAARISVLSLSASAIRVFIHLIPSYTTVPIEDFLPADVKWYMIGNVTNEFHFIMTKETALFDSIIYFCTDLIIL